MLPARSSAVLVLFRIDFANRRSRGSPVKERAVNLLTKTRRYTIVASTIGVLGAIPLHPVHARARA